MKYFILLIMGLFVSLLVISCATQLPAYDPSLPDSETAILIVPKNIYIIKMDDIMVGTIFQQSDGLRQIRIPAGTHTFHASSEENILVYDALGINALTGYSSNYRTRKGWLDGTITHTFEAGKRYKISSALYHRGTFDSQFVVFTITPPSPTNNRSNSTINTNNQTRRPVVQLQTHIPENNLHKDFYGLWKNIAGATRDIYASTLIISNGVVTFIVRIDSIAQVENYNDENKKDYPNGFMFVGEIVDMVGGTIPGVGNVGDNYIVSYFININGMSFISDRDTSIWNKQ